MALGVCAWAGAAFAEDVPQAQIDAMRAALSKYEDPYVAVRDLYLSTVGCVHYDGTKMEGHMDYPKGAMGIHFVNLTIQGPLDPAKPNVLIYEPWAKASSSWWRPNGWCPRRWPRSARCFSASPSRARWKATSRSIPQGFHHYDLHAWLFKDNPNGMFSPTNPTVSCDNAEFSLMEMPTKIVAP